MGPGFVAFELGLEGVFCVEEKWISLKKIGDFLQGWNGLWAGGFALGRRNANPSWANGIVRGIGFDGS